MSGRLRAKTHCLRCKAISWALVLMTASVSLVSNCISLVLFLVIEFSLNTAIFPLFLWVVCWRSENMGDGYVRKWSVCEELWRLRNRWLHFVVINGSNKWSNGDIGFEDYRKEREVFRKKKELEGMIIPSCLLRIFSLSIVALIIGCVRCCFCLTWHGLEPSLYITN